MSDSSNSASAQIDGRIKELGDWRGKTLSHLRSLIKQAVPDVEEEWKWRGVPCWFRDGMICTGETYKDHVKLTFSKGASLPDPKKLFTQPGTVRRAIDLHEGDKLNDKDFKDLIRSAVALNQSSGKKSAKKTSTKKAAPRKPAARKR